MNLGYDLCDVTVCPDLGRVWSLLISKQLLIRLEGMYIYNKFCVYVCWNKETNTIVIVFIYLIN